MTETILQRNGSSFQRTVRSQRMLGGKLVGSIHDKGYLVMVRFDSIGWTPIHVIRKIGK